MPPSMVARVVGEYRRDFSGEGPPVCTSVDCVVLWRGMSTSRRVGAITRSAFASWWVNETRSGKARSGWRIPKVAQLERPLVPRAEKLFLANKCLHLLPLDRGRNADV